MIANGTDIGSFIPTINFKVGNNRLSDYINSAQDEIVRKVLGTDIEQSLETPIAQGATDSHAALRTMVKRAIYLTAFLNAIPELDLQMSEAGFVVASNTAVSPASRERVNALSDRVKIRKSDALDKMHCYLIDNSKTENSQYANWRSTAQFAHLGSGFIMSLREFNNCFIVNDDVFMGQVFLWDDWYKMIPRMNDSLYGDIAEYVSAEYISELLEKKFDAENLLSLERSVEYKISCAVVAAARGQRDVMRNQAIQARNIMLRNISSFPTFKNSAAYELPELNIGKQTDGVANLL